MSVIVKNLSFSYQDRLVLDSVSFTAQSGSLTAVLGPNGAGKSTLFKCMLGLLQKYEGNITIDSQNTRDLQPEKLAQLAAYIPQSHDAAFNFSVFDMVLMGTTARLKGFRVPNAAEKETTEKALDRLNILSLKNRSYMQISGGERQLVLIARALAQQTKVLVMDEPTANLDYGNQLRVLDQIKSLAAEGYTVLQSTHHPDQAFLYADRILALSGGKILADGTPKETVSKDLIKRLYGVDVIVESLYKDTVRYCIPENRIK